MLKKGRKKVIRTISKPRNVTHINGAEFVARHQYCITMNEVRNVMSRSNSRFVSYGLGIPHVRESVFQPDSMPKAHCDHPEDGICGHDMPSEEQLAKINERLGGKVPPPDKMDRTVDRLVGTISHDDVPKTKEVKPKESKQPKEPKVPVVVKVTKLKYKPKGLSNGSILEIPNRAPLNGA